MKSRLILTTLVVTLLAGMVLAQGPSRHLNPMIDLMEQGQPVFGLYMPRGPRGARGAPPVPMAEAARQAAEAAREAIGNKQIDFLFNGGMPAAFGDFIGGLKAGGVLQNGRLTHPMMLKIHKISEDPIGAVELIGEQLNYGTSGQMFVEAESAEEVLFGLTAMRLASRGGTRPDDVGNAPAYWGMSEAEYREKADLWPLNPNGELVNWTIIESDKGLVNTREIASVKGIGVLWPGSGTLRGVTSRRDENGERVADPVAHEAAIQKVLAACIEFNIACGIPANPQDIEKRMAQGFSDFVMNWGEAGFESVEIGRRASGRTTMDQQ